MIYRSARTTGKGYQVRLLNFKLKNTDSFQNFLLNFKYIEAPLELHRNSYSTLWLPVAKFKYNFRHILTLPDAAIVTGF